MIRSRALWRRRRVSRRGVRLVAGFEGFRPNPYRDPVGVWTIGYGETKGIGPRTPPWSQRKARRRLRRRLNRDFAPAVRALALPLGQPSFDALVSLVYNLGPAIVAPSSSLGLRLRGGRHSYILAANAMLLYVYADGHVLPGLLHRRRAERRLFLKGL